MVDSAIQTLARSQLRYSARRLIAALGNIYTTPQQGRLLEAYIQRHMLTQLDIASLPAAIPQHGALSDGAKSLADDFFTAGRDGELDWRLENAPHMADAVRSELAGLIERLLLLPAQRVEWRDEWTEELRQAAEKNRAKMAEKAVAEAEPGKEDQKQSTDIGGQQPKHWDATNGQQDDDLPEDDDDDWYRAQQASLWTANEEDRKRMEEQQRAHTRDQVSEPAMDDAAWAESGASRIAVERQAAGEKSTVRPTVQAASLEHAETNGDGADDLAHGCDGLQDGDSEDQDATAPKPEVATSQAVANGAALGGGVTDRTATMIGDGGRYGCDMCEQRFSDVLTLNEHWAKHFGE